MSKNEQYDEYFGFTEEEVRSLIDMADEDTKGEIEALITELLLDTISFNDAYESFYHGFLAGILSGMKGIS